MPLLSIIIPHKNRPGMLEWHLNALSKQSMKDFEVVVVDDHSQDTLEKLDVFLDLPNNTSVYMSDGIGPNAARNTGLKHARSDIILVVGDDCIPDEHLVFRHWYMHQKVNKPIAVQGYTPFHPQVMGSEFMQWLDTSGLQANWQATKQDDGRAKEQVNGYCLTTNYSINKRTLEDFGGFNEYFIEPAWDDVAFGYKFQMLGGVTYFDPHAVNWHFHQYNLRQFAQRQFMVGRNVWRLGLQHSELSQNLVKPEELRFARQQELEEWLHRAYSIYYGKDIIDKKQQTWHDVIHLAMVLGQLDEMDRRGKYWQVFEHLHRPESIVYSLDGIRGIEEDNYGWVMHCVEWLLQDIPDNWAVWAYAGEVYNHYGMTDEAHTHFAKSMEMAPSEWARQHLV